MLYDITDVWTQNMCVLHNSKCFTSGWFYWIFPRTFPPACFYVLTSPACPRSLAGTHTCSAQISSQKKIAFTFLLPSFSPFMRSFVFALSLQLSLFFCCLSSEATRFIFFLSNCFLHILFIPTILSQNVFFQEKKITSKIFREKIKAHIMCKASR